MKDKIKSFFWVRALINIKKGLPYPKNVGRYSKFRICLSYFFSALFGKYTLEEYFYSYKLYAVKNRKEFISNYNAHKLEAKLNGINRIECFRDKKEFNKIFGELIHRNWIYIRETTKREFFNFCKLGFNKYDLICKPVDSSMGRGIFKISCEEAFDNDELFEKLYKGNYICEQCLIAIDSISEFHPNSLNTIRITTYRKNNVVKILFSFFRTGNNQNVVDNAHGNGVWAMIDVNTGNICTKGSSKDGLKFDAHPFSNKKFIGFSIPMWNEIVALAKKASDIYPQAVIAGWDFAVCNDGNIELIEGNSKPDLDVVQQGYECGMKKLLRDLLKK